MRTVYGALASTVLSVAVMVPPASADFISSTLGAAGPTDWAVLETGNGNVSLANAAGAGFITGNVGLNGGNVSDSGVPITGNVVFGTAATGIASLTGEVSGTTTLNQVTLTSAVTAATSASSTFAALAPTLSNTSITGTTTINLAPGVNVADLTSVNLGGGQVLTLNGPAGSQIILNDTGGVTLNSGQIVVTGGLSLDDVVFNITGGTFATSGGLGNEAIADGVFLDLNGQIHLTPGAVNGEIISGQSINIASGGSVAGSAGQSSVPEPTSLVLLGTAFAGFAMIRRRRS